MNDLSGFRVLDNFLLYPSAHSLVCLNICFPSVTGRHILAAIFQLGGNRMLCQGAGENRCYSNKILFALEEGERSPNLVLGVLCYTGRKIRDFL